MTAGLTKLLLQVDGASCGGALVSQSLLATLEGPSGVIPFFLFEGVGGKLRLEVCNDRGRL